MPPSDPSAPEEDQDIGLKLVNTASESGTSSDSSDPQSSTPDGDSVEPRSDPRRLPVWLFVLALILFSLVIGWQAQLASELESQVAGLEVQLEQTNALLDSHRTHLSEVRGGVHELSERLQSLRALVDRDPTDRASEGVVPTP
jgi:uncharacterized coiled-coil protein SlyX